MDHNALIRLARQERDRRRREERREERARDQREQSPAHTSQAPTTSPHPDTNINTEQAVVPYSSWNITFNQNAPLTLGGAPGDPGNAGVNNHHHHHHSNHNHNYNDENNNHNMSMHMNMHGGSTGRVIELDDQAEEITNPGGYQDEQVEEDGDVRQVRLVKHIFSGSKFVIKVGLLLLRTLYGIATAPLISSLMSWVLGFMICAGILGLLILSASQFLSQTLAAQVMATGYGWLKPLFAGFSWTWQTTTSATCAVMGSAGSAGSAVISAVVSAAPALPYLVQVVEAFRPAVDGNIVFVANYLDAKAQEILAAASEGTTLAAKAFGPNQMDKNVLERDWTAIAEKAAKDAERIHEVLYSSIEYETSQLFFIKHVARDIIQDLTDMYGDGDEKERKAHLATMTTTTTTTEHEVPTATSKKTALLSHISKLLFDSEPSIPERLQQALEEMVSLTVLANHTRANFVVVSRHLLKELSVTLEIQSGGGETKRPDHVFEQGIANLDQAFVEAGGGGDVGWDWTFPSEQNRLTPNKHNMHPAYDYTQVLTSVEDANFVENLHLGRAAGELLTGSLTDARHRLLEQYRIVDRDHQWLEGQLSSLKVYQARVDKNKSAKRTARDLLYIARFLVEFVERFERRLEEDYFTRE